MDRLRQIRSQLPHELPTIEEIRTATAGKTQEEIAATAKRTLEGMDPQKVEAFGKVLQESLARKGMRPPAGVSQGNVNEIASLMATMLTGKNAASAKTLLQNSAVQDSAKGVFLTKLAMSRFGLIAMLLRDPRTAQFIGPVIKSLMKTK